MEGGEIPATIVCATCATPHHRDCFRYNGACATYACQGRRFVERPGILMQSTMSLLRNALEFGPTVSGRVHARMPPL